MSTRLLPRILAITTITASTITAATEQNSIDWSGAYIGLNVGHTWSKLDAQNPSGSAANTPIGHIQIRDQPINDNGVLGGIGLGFNYQVNHLLLGLEADFQATDLHNAANSLSTISSTRRALTTSVSNTANSSMSSDWLSTIRGRIGFANGRFLGYLTGGLAIADFSSTQSKGATEYSYRCDQPAGSLLVPCLAVLAPVPTPATSASWKRTLMGWTVGAGTEYLVLEHLSLKAEYLYSYFSQTGGSHSEINDGFSHYTVSASTSSLSEHTARIGVNYRF